MLFPKHLAHCEMLNHSELVENTKRKKKKPLFPCLHAVTCAAGAR